MTFRTGSLALAVLATALGTTAFADPAFNTGAPREHVIAPPGAIHTSFEIVVNKFGKKIRGSNGTSVTTLDTGNFIVDFPADVTGCSYVATLGRATTDGGVDEDPGYVTVVGANGEPVGVYIQTFSLRGKLRNRPFHLLVAC